MSAQEQLTDMYRVQVEALQKENARLNEEIRQVKNLAFKLRLTDPNFDKPLKDLEVNYEIVKP